MHRIRPETVEVYVPHVFEDGLYAVADPALGKKRHIKDNRIPVRTVEELWDYRRMGWPVWMKGLDTGQRNLISNDIEEGPPPHTVDTSFQRGAAVSTDAAAPETPCTQDFETSPSAESGAGGWPDILASMDASAVEAESWKPRRFLMGRKQHGSTVLSVAWAPFDHVNPGARIVIVGLTPGRRQMRDALDEMRRALGEGASIEAASERAKVHASFAGAMRTNLARMLDATGVADGLGIGSAASLWAGDSGLAHFTSLLRYPVFANGENYSGNPDPNRVPWLMESARQWLGEELRAIPNAVVIPMGEKVSEAVVPIARAAGLPAERVLSGFPHASPANNGRIGRFLGSEGEDDPFRRRFHAVRACVDAAFRNVDPGASPG